MLSNQTNSNDDDDDDIDNEDDDCNCGISLTFGFIQNEDWGDWGQPGNGPPASGRLEKSPKKRQKSSKLGPWPIFENLKKPPLRAPPWPRG